MSTSSLGRLMKNSPMIALSWQFWRRGIVSFSTAFLFLCLSLMLLQNLTHVAIDVFLDTGIFLFFLVSPAAAAVACIATDGIPQRFIFPVSSRYLAIVALLHTMICKPEKIPFISYPYEWCFSQLQQAAVTTLEIQKTAMNYNMTLKDCSSYNIQFHNGKAILIDTLSFEKYEEGQFWNGYRQFCQHFLAPLALMSKKDIRLNQLLRIYVDGIPLDLTSKLLPLHTRSSFFLLSHIHAHSKSQKHFEEKKIDSFKKRKLGRSSFLGIIVHEV